MNQYQVAKEAAAEYALRYFDGQGIIGLGSGSTAQLFVKALSKKFPNKEGFQCVSTSSSTAKLAKSLGFKLLEDSSFERTDLTVDGADEVNRTKCMIKGGEGALLREKVVASVSKKHLTIINREKLHSQLGQFFLPIEIAPYGSNLTQKRILDAIKSIDLSVEWSSLRKKDDGSIYITDNGFYIFDVKMKVIDRPQLLSDVLHQVVGVIEHGLFIGLTDIVIVAGQDGKIELME